MDLHVLAAHQAIGDLLSLRIHRFRFFSARSVRPGITIHLQRVTELTGRASHAAPGRFPALRGRLHAPLAAGVMIPTYCEQPVLLVFLATQLLLLEQAVLLVHREHSRLPQRACRVIRACLGRTLDQSRHSAQHAPLEFTKRGLG